MLLKDYRIGDEAQEKNRIDNAYIYVPENTAVELAYETMKHVEEEFHVNYQIGSNKIIRIGRIKLVFNI